MGLVISYFFSAQHYHKQDIYFLFQVYTYHNHHTKTFQNLYDQYQTAEGDLKDLLITKIQEFKKAIECTPYPTRALHLDFSKYIIKEDPTVEKVLDMFGGRVL